MATKEEQLTTDTPTTTAPTGDSSALINAFVKRELASGGITSSQDTGLQESIKATQEAREAGRASITGEAERARTDIIERRGETRKDIIARQRGVGFETTSARLEEFDERTTSRLKDLADRKKEALRVGDTNFVAEIKKLELQELQNRTKAEQQSFTNMLQIAGLQQGITAEERISKQATSQLEFQKRQQTFQEQTLMAGILQGAGEELKEGDTLQTVMDRTKGFYAKKSKAELNVLQEQVNQFNKEREKLQIDTVVNGFIEEIIASGEVLSGTAVANKVAGMIDLGTGIKGLQAFNDIAEKAQALIDEREPQVAFEKAKETGVPMKMELYFDKETGKYSLVTKPIPAQASDFFTGTGTGQFAQPGVPSLGLLKKKDDVTKLTIGSDEEALFSKILGF